MEAAQYCNVASCRGSKGLRVRVCACVCVCVLDGIFLIRLPSLVLFIISSGRRSPVCLNTVMVLSSYNLMMFIPRVMLSKSPVLV